MGLPSSPRSNAPERDPYFAAPSGSASGRPFWRRPPHRAVLMGFAVAVLLYSVAVLFLVAWMGDIGVRCVFSTDLKEPVPRSYKWSAAPPERGDVLVAIGSVPIAN